MMPDKKLLDFQYLADDQRPDLTAFVSIGMHFKQKASFTVRGGNARVRYASVRVHMYYACMCVTTSACAYAYV